MIAQAFTSWRGRKAEARVEVAPVAQEAAGTYPLFAEIKDEFLSAALVDQVLGVAITPEAEGFDGKEAEALANAGFVEIVRNAATWLCPGDEVMEIRVVTKDQVQFIRPLDASGSMFLFAAMDKEKGAQADVERMRMRMLELAFGL